MVKIFKLLYCSFFKNVYFLVFNKKVVIIWILVFLIFSIYFSNKDIFWNRKGLFCLLERSYVDPYIQLFYIDADPDTNPNFTSLVKRTKKTIIHHFLLFHFLFKLKHLNNAQLTLYTFYLANLSLVLTFCKWATVDSHLDPDPGKMSGPDLL